MIKKVEEWKKKYNPKKMENISGLTNESFIITFDDKKMFLQFKKFNGFNHKIDYQILNEFEHVPKLIESKENYNLWEFIDASKDDISKEDKIIRACTILKKLHKSKLKFPEIDIKEIIDNYIELANKLNENVMPKEINNMYSEAIDRYKKLSKDTPIHYDPWLLNFIFTNEKDYLIDFEFACMGDRYWDIAYIMEGSQLNDKEKEFVLKQFGKLDYKKLDDAIFLVNYITLVWLYKHENYNLFPHQNIINRLNEKSNLNN
ncbi:MAG: phosphotransferase [Mycoplasma sp.]|nr:phosphotransferase [Mycoplasma sp.]